MKKATREWVRKAENDYRFAMRNAQAAEGFYDQLCFHFEQSAEKYLKALQEELGLTIRRTQDLKEILAKLLPHYPRAGTPAARYDFPHALCCRYTVSRRHGVSATSTR